MFSVCICIRLIPRETKDKKKIVYLFRPRLESLLENIKWLLEVENKRGITLISNGGELYGSNLIKELPKILRHSIKRGLEAWKPR